MMQNKTCNSFAGFIKGHYRDLWPSSGEHTPHWSWWTHTLHLWCLQWKTHINCRSILFWGVLQEKGQMCVSGSGVSWCVCVYVCVFRDVKTW